MVEPLYIKGVPKQPLADVLQNSCPWKIFQNSQENTRLRVKEFLFFYDSCDTINKQKINKNIL